MTGNANIFIILIILLFHAHQLWYFSATIKCERVVHVLVHRMLYFDCSEMNGMFHGRILFDLPAYYNEKVEKTKRKFLSQEILIFTSFKQTQKGTLILYLH